MRHRPKSSPRNTRVLFLDDSGKPSLKHSSKAVVIGGFSITSQDAATLSRRIAGAKSRFYPVRGAPGQWELKSTDTIRPKRWKRAKNRLMLAEMIRILSALDCTVYSASIDKSRMHHAMSLQTTMPLQLQVLLEHFAVECGALRETGLVVSDWSNHQLDAHASQSIASFVTSQRLPVHPAIYYANSLSLHPIQVSDLIAGIRRRALEGDPNLHRIDDDLAAIRTLPPSATYITTKGRNYTNRIRVF